MTDEQGQLVAWNDEARISCEFSFKCPKTWERLSPTAIAGIRHCSECDRNVHLVLTQEDLRRHAERGDCVAVKVLQVERSAENRREVYAVGNVVAAPYNPHLKPL